MKTTNSMSATPRPARGFLLARLKIARGYH